MADAPTPNKTFLNLKAIITAPDIKAALDRALSPEKFNVPVLEALQRALSHVKQLTPGSGRIREMWQLDVEYAADGKIREAVIQNNYKDQKIIRFLEFGTKKHVILPRDAKVLAFRDERGEWVFTKRVDHPGTGQYPFGYQMAKKTRELLATLMKQASARLAKNLQEP